MVSPSGEYMTQTRLEKFPTQVCGPMKGNSDDDLSALLAQIRANPVERHPPLIKEGTVVIACGGDSTGGIAIAKRIGLGTHAEVYEVYHTGQEDGPLSFALKVEKPLKLAVGILENEIKVLRKLTHLRCVPQIVGEYVVKIASAPCAAVGLEQFAGPLSMLRQARSVCESVTTLHQVLQFVSVQMVEAVSAIHREGFLHRDIKPSNFMFKLDLDRSIRIALIDFGSAIGIGERTTSEFRGTGAYLAINTDPFASSVLDDFWAVGFSLLDMAVVGGLPWRSVSARTEEGRTEIKSIKVALLEKIRFSESDQVLDALPSFVKQILADLYSETELQIFLQRHQVAVDGSCAFSLFRKLIARQTHFPKDMVGAHNPPYLALTDGTRRSAFERVRLTPGSVAFSLPNVASPNICLNLVSLISSYHSKPRDHNSVETSPGHRVRICLLQLMTGECGMTACPLLHYQWEGILAYAIQRWFRMKNSVCVSHCLSGKCKDRKCPQIHLSKKILDAVYLSGDIVEAVFLDSN